MASKPKGPLFAFTKLMVGDVDRVFAFYARVIGIEQQHRVCAGEGEDALDEIIAKPLGGSGPPVPSFIIKSYVNRPAPAPGEVQLGFLVPSVDAVLAAAAAAGGAIHKPARDMAEHGVRVGFIRDVEGHVSEIVEML